MICRACLRPAESDYHPACVRTLFGTDRIPSIDLELAKLHTVALSMVGETVLSGAQRKISLGLSSDRLTLRVTLQGAQYILKPSSETFPALPAVELTSMRILEACGVSVPPCALVDLRDGTPAYVIKRFDRLDDGTKLRMEDFCQLTLRSPKDKYRGSAELTAKVVARYATAPIIELQKLYRRLACAWLIGDGDLHLKNLALLTPPNGTHALSPAYDAVATRLYIPDDHLALPVRGRDARLNRKSWLAFANDVSLPERAAARVLDEIVAAAPDAFALVHDAPLPGDLGEAFERLLTQRFATLQ